MQLEKPVVDVKASQDKIRMAHHVPVHPEVVEVVYPLLDGRDDNKHIFSYYSFYKWVKQQKIPLLRIADHFVLGDLRKFAEQYGDIIQWDQSNRAYILTHGVSGVEWSHYRHPLPEYVYEVYMKYWSDVYFIQQNLHRFFKNAALLFQQLFWSPELLEASLSRRYLLFKVVEENYK